MRGPTRKVWLFLLLGAIWVANADAAVIYVNASGTGADSGQSWVDAYTDLQDALAIAE